jgi:hypothetical protein
MKKARWKLGLVEEHVDRWPNSVIHVLETQSGPSPCERRCLVHLPRWCFLYLNLRWEKRGLCYSLFFSLLERFLQDSEIPMLLNFHDVLFWSLISLNFESFHNPWISNELNWRELSISSLTSYWVLEHWISDE